MSKTIGVTGPNGFVARWVIERLGREEGCTLVELPRKAWQDSAALQAFVSRCDTIIHLAGVNRGTKEEVEQTNGELAASLTNACRDADATPHLIYSSTTKRTDDTPYGRGKRQAERIFADWANQTGAASKTLVIPNVYGAGCRPFYNSVVATFCHQLTHSETPSVKDDASLDLLWVGDLAEQMVATALSESVSGSTDVALSGDTTLKVSELLMLLEGFRDSYFDRNVVPDITTPFRATLYSTFLSYLELTDHVHRPPVHTDARGGLCEVIKTDAGGQVFFSTTEPGVTRGNHYHTRKCEWFCVVRGEATIRLRHIHEDPIHEFRVSGERPEFLSIPVLHTHSIENHGDAELLTLFWTNELFDADNPDTFYLDVLPKTPVAQVAA